MSVPVKKVGILTAGGLAPCLSSAIGYLIERYTKVAPQVEIICYVNGYMGLLKGDSLQVSVARAQAPTDRQPHVRCRVSHSGRAFSSDEINQVLNASEKEWKKINSSIAIGTYNLAISRRILEAQGGTLRVEGPDGKQTTVEFTLLLV